MAEVALDPDLEIVDPHHHLWDHPGSRYLMDELHADTASGHRVVATVFVECLSEYRTDGPEHLRPVGETEFVVAETAGRRPPVAGIVGFADLTHPAAADALAAHVEAAGGRFRGIRHANAFDESPDIRPSHTRPPARLFSDPAFGRGMEALAAAGLSFDAWLFHPQLPELTQLAREHPDVPIVLDHLGGPLGIGPYAGRRDEVRQRWRLDLADVAACPNVDLKVGGIGMPIFGLGWHHRTEPVTSEELAAAWRDDLRWCIDLFGVDRCMFESNFPVDKASCSYLVLWNTFKRVADEAGYTPAERSALFAGTARRAYRLDDAVNP
jgi:predicted TIM-barrel fold metal-dependent hydrolase